MLVVLHGLRAFGALLAKATGNHWHDLQRTRGLQRSRSAVEDVRPADQVATQQALITAGLSYNAAMSVARGLARCPSLSADSAPATPPGAALPLALVLQRVAELQSTFGRPATTKMLLRDPSLIGRHPTRLAINFRGLSARLGITNDEALAVAVASPYLMTCSPDTVVKRLANLQQMLGVPTDQALKLAKRFPLLLKASPKRLRENINFLRDECRVDGPTVGKWFRYWPLLATQSLELLRSRLDGLRELLGASEEDVRRVLSSHPNLLARDPDVLRCNMQAYATALGEPLGWVQDACRRQPGLLSYNVATLLSRFTYCAQMLQLPREASLTLLTYNKKLLELAPGELAARVEALCRLMGLSEQELYTILHRRLTFLRFSPETLEAKWATLTAVTALHPSWVGQAAAQVPAMRLRMLTVGWTSLYRLVFLLQTAQAGGVRLQALVRMTHDSFDVLYPDFAGWLQRYNAAAGAALALPPQGRLRPLSPRAKGALVYPHLRAPDSLASAAGANQSEPAALPSSASSGAAAGGGDPADGCGAAGAAPPAGVKATRAALLAHVLSCDEAVAAHLMVVCPQAYADTSWHRLVTRLDCLWSVLAFMGAAPPMPHAPAAAAWRPHAGVADADGVRVGSGADVPRAAVGWEGEGAAATPLLRLHEGLTREGAAHEGDERDAADLPHQQQQQQQQRVRLLPPLEHEAARALVQRHGGKAEAAALAVALALHLPPYSGGLWQPPAPRPRAVVEVLLCKPRLLMGVHTEVKCRWVLALASATPAIREHLLGLTPSQVARALVLPRARYEMLEFLVATQQPQPWAFTVAEVLSYGRRCTRAAFEEAYPAFKSWQPIM